jgi:hypothetical protein
LGFGLDSGFWFRHSGFTESVPLPRIIDYPDVLSRLTSQGLVSLYHNSGAFGFPKGIESFARGWIGPADPTIRPQARELTRQVAEPYEKSLAELTTRVWVEALPGPVWVMPKSHWSYELDFGSKTWMPQALASCGMGSELLIARNNAAAIEFLPDESVHFASLLTALLKNLIGSDFALAFPGREIIATVHHHKQVWWMTTKGDLVKQLDALVA